MAKSDLERIIEDMAKAGGLSIEYSDLRRDDEPWTVTCGAFVRETGPTMRLTIEEVYSRLMEK